jgi:PAS domain S-box-containing protein
MDNKKIKILAIDDNRDNLVTLKALLIEVFPESVVYLETNGKVGIETARKNEPDVIILDIVMPEMDGYEVCRIIKSDKQLSEIPVVFLTVLNKDKQSRISALEAGGEAFLAKPIDSIELKAQINAMLKIKEADRFKRNEKIRLKMLVQKRTEELRKSNIASLNLLEDLKAENEIRKQRERDLKASEEKFRNLFHNHSAVKLIIDPENGNIVEGNKSAADFYGWSVETLQKMNISQINTLPPEDIKIVINNVLALKAKYFEFQHRKSDGSLVDVEVFSSIIKIGDKNFLHSIIHDISEKKKAEEKVKLLSRAVESSSVSITITDSEGKIIYTNPFFSKITGYSLEEVQGKNPRILKSGFHSKEFYKKLWNTILSGKDWTGEFQNKRKNGELYWVNAVISPIINNYGAVSNFAAVEEDITERKRIMEELGIAKEKAEESDRLKSAFLANMSHEIRTPMNGILGFAELLKTPGLTGSEQEKYIGIIEKSGIRMLNIINNIIDISKIEAGLMELNIKESKINEQIEYIYSFFKPETEAKKIKLSFKTSLPPEKAVIKTDCEKVYAILTNLVKNAIKYTEEGGSIEFGYYPITESKPNELKFYVKDTGIGIPKDRIEAIFERFIQADIADKMAYQGAGLGLTISKAYIEMLGGKISVESEEGNLSAGQTGGSTFYFTLPYNTEPPSGTIESPSETIESPAEQTEKKGEDRKLKIMIVEDDEVSVMLIERYIKIFSKEIFKAHTGYEAIEICKANPDIDIILMDILIPGVGGIEATKQIKEFNKEVVIIAQTAYALFGDREKALEAGCDDYISKPINRAKLQAMIQKYSVK